MKGSQNLKNSGSSDAFGEASQFVASRGESARNEESQEFQPQASDLTGTLRAERRTEEDVAEPLSPRVRRERASIYPRVRGTFVRSSGAEESEEKLTEKAPASVYPQIQVRRGALARKKASEAPKRPEKPQKGAETRRSTPAKPNLPNEAEKSESVAETLVQTQNPPEKQEKPLDAATLVEQIMDGLLGDPEPEKASKISGVPEISTIPTSSPARSARVQPLETADLERISTNSVSEGANGQPA